MFDYSFKETNCLIQHITIVEKTITFYLNKPGQYDSPELKYLESVLKLHVMSTFHPKHYFLHNLYSPLFKNHLPHVHYSFPGNPKDMLPRIARALVFYQDNFAARTKNFNAFKEEMNKMRIQNGDEKLSEDVQDSVDNFDCKTPFIPVVEVEDLLASFDNYLNPQNPLRLLDKINDVIFSKILALKGRDALERRGALENYVSSDDFKKLDCIRELLLEYAVTKKEDLLTQAKKKYNEILNTPQIAPQSENEYGFLSYSTINNKNKDTIQNNKVAVTEASNVCTIL